GEQVKPDARRENFGIESLDHMLKGGIPTNSSTMLMGVPGSGKTLLGLHFLAAGARLGQPGLYWGFNESPARLSFKANSVGLDFDQLVAQGRIHIRWQAPLEGILDVMGEALIEEVRRTNTRRVFIDGLVGLQKAADYPDRVDNFLIALVNQLDAL